MEITRFQDELMKNMEEETARSQSVSSRSGNEASEDFMEWTFAKAFLYSLTVLTTIGKSENDLISIFLCEKKSVLNSALNDELKG